MTSPSTTRKTRCGQERARDEGDLGTRRVECANELLEVARWHRRFVVVAMRSHAVGHRAEPTAVNIRLPSGRTIGTAGRCLLSGCLLL